MQTSISVIMPCWNTAAWLEETMASLLCQDLSDIQILCMDDGSTDDTGVMLDRYAAEYPFVHVIHNENHGQGWERNKAIALSTGKYIYYMDSDDALAPGSLKQLYDLSEAQELDLILFEAQAFYESEELRQKYPAFQTLYRRKKQWPGIWEGKDLYTHFRFQERWNVSPCLQLVRRDLLMAQNIRFAETSMYEDNIYYAQVMFAAKRVACIQNPFYHRRVREASTMTSTPDPKRKTESIAAVVKGLLSIATQADGQNRIAVLTHLGKFYSQPAIQEFIVENHQQLQQLYVSLSPALLVQMLSLQSSQIFNTRSKNEKLKNSSQKQGKSASVDTLRATVAESKLKINELTTSLDKYKRKNTELQTRVNKLCTSNDELKQEISVAKSALSVAKAQIDFARAETEKMRLTLEEERSNSFIKRFRRKTKL